VKTLTSREFKVVPSTTKGSCCDSWSGARALEMRSDKGFIYTREDTFFLDRPNINAWCYLG